MTLPLDHVAYGDCVEVMKDILGHPNLPPRALCGQGDPLVLVFIAPLHWGRLAQRIQTS